MIPMTHLMLHRQPTRQSVSNEFVIRGRRNQRMTKGFSGATSDSYLLGRRWAIITPSPSLSYPTVPAPVPQPLHSMTHLC